MLPGVFLSRKKDNTPYYRANITYRNKHISIGSYSTEADAAKAYQEAWIMLHGEDSIDQIVDYYLHPDSMMGHMTLTFEKCVILVNYRVNHVYMATPIYMRHNYFSYYLSPSEELKFDIDDLFYYSQHKIMRRKGHLFVNDYGMQVTILSRYGIKSHAVCHRDYEFSNGDFLDYRYSNVIVINRYHGVTKYEKNGKVRYRVKIHINGNYTIGTYASEEKAAIAYNKAVDLAHQAGIKKNFPKNYIEQISGTEYFEIYEKTKISEKYQIYLMELWKQKS